MKKRLFLLMCILVLSVNLMRAEGFIKRTKILVPQSDLNYEKFTNVTSEFNLSLLGNRVLSFCQNDKKQMLMGTLNGLFAFDGRRLNQISNTNYKIDFNNLSIREIVQDKKQRLWMVTLDSLAVWDPVFRKTVVYKASTLKKEHPFRHLKGAFKDSDDSIWLYGYKRLYCFQQETSSFVDYSHLIPDSINTIYQIYKDRQNRFWVLTDKKIYQVVKNGLSSSKQDAIQLVESTLFTGKQFDSIRGVYQDTSNAFWLISRSRLLRISFDIGMRNIHEIQEFEQDSPKSIFMREIVQRKNAVYVLSSQGIFMYDLATRSSVVYRSSSLIPEGNTEDVKLMRLFVDNGGDLWLSTFDHGVYFYSPSTTAFHACSNVNNVIKNNKITSVAQDGDRNIWFTAQNRGLVCWDIHNNVVIDCGIDPVKKSLVPTKLIGNLISLSNRLFFLAGNVMTNHLYSYDKTTGKYTCCNLKESDSDFSYKITSIVPNDNKSIWIGTLDGLFLFDVESEKVIRNPHIKEGVSLLRAQLDYIWVQTASRMYKIDKKGNIHSSVEIAHAFTPSVFPSVFIESNDHLYISGKNGGLWKGSTTAASTSEFERIEALENAFIMTVLKDGDNLWMATNVGIYSYNTETGKIKFFNAKDGLKTNSFVINGGLITDGGLLIFGNNLGITCFDPSVLKENSIEARVILSDLYLRNRIVGVGEPDSPLKKALAYTDKIEVHESTNNVGFSFSSTNYRNPSKNVYEYRLDPFDTDWVKSYDASQMANYYNLAPGKYTFRVRTHNGDNEWSEEASVGLVVVPYWWKLPWMKVVYVFLVLFLLALLFNLDKKQLQKKHELIQMQKEQELFRSKMDFFTCMAHEVRTPLTLIIGPLNRLLKNKEVVDKYASELNVMDRNSQRLLMLVNKLMDYRKVEEKAYTIQLSTIDIREVVETVASDFKVLNHNGKVSINVNLPAEPCWAQVDREAFVKVCVNLFSNACKFTSTSVQIALMPSDDEINWVLSVADDGCGISQENQKRVFDSFYQVSDNQPKDNIGTGIGLYVVRRLVELQQGSINLLSELDKGTCFKVSFARSAAPVLHSEIKKEFHVPYSEKVEEATANEVKKGKKQLLVVEDSEDMRVYIKSIFEEEFYVDTCANGEEALQYVSETEYDLIITDLMMPVMDGLTLLKTLKNNVETCHIPVVILTAKADEKSQIEGLGEKAEAYLSKPFVSEVLSTQVKSIIQNRDYLCARFQTEFEVKSTDLCLNTRDQLFITRVDEYIHSHITNVNLCVDEIAEEIGLGRSIFYRKMHAITGMTPNDYIRTLRLKKAMEMLKSGNYRINEVCYDVGFSSPSYFSKRFTAQFGYTPSDLLKSL